jgi:S1-C subfamily serine protease
MIAYLRSKPISLAAKTAVLAGASVLVMTTSHVARAETPEQSVVKITCSLVNGEANATGFVWSAPNRVVTALHAVAGCERIMVWSETTEKRSPASVFSVRLEADLALLELERDLGLRPLVHSETLPAIDDEFTIWGYPRAIPSVLGSRIAFTRGLTDEVTLGDAFFRSPDELLETLGGQSYPTWDTKILRVGSTLQPGHSGAPIVDRNGVVVAIADGGLFNGVAGINWSIPAATYLSDLEQSRDIAPDRPSNQNTLLSTFAPRREMSVEFQYGRDDGQARTGVLSLARTIPLADVMRFAKANTAELIEKQLDYIKDSLEEAQVDFADLSLDVYEEYEGGATIVVPSNAVIEWDEERRVIEAMDPDDVVGILLTIGTAQSFADAVAVAERHSDLVRSYEDWDRVEAIEDEEDTEFRRTVTIFEIFANDDDEEPAIMADQVIMIEGGDVLASAIFNWEPIGELTARQLIFYDMLWIGEYLSEFAKH